MNGVDIVKLAADLTAGAITTEAIQSQFGPGVLSAVLGIGGGIGAGLVANALLNVLNEHTGVVDDVGGLIDDVFDLF